MYEKGEYVEKDHEKALKYYTRCAEKGSALGINILAHKYQNGDEEMKLEKNLQKSFEYYKKGAKMGLTSSFYYLALMYQNGDFVKLDLKKSFKYHLLSAQSDDNSTYSCYSSYFVGKHYLAGDIVPHNLEKLKKIISLHIFFLFLFKKNYYQSTRIPPKSSNRR